MTTDPPPLRMALIVPRAMRKTLASWFDTIVPGCTVLSYVSSAIVERGDALDLVAIGPARRRGSTRKLFGTSATLPSTPIIVVPYRAKHTLRTAMS